MCGAPSEWGTAVFDARVLSDQQGHLVTSVGGASHHEVHGTDHPRLLEITGVLGEPVLLETKSDQRLRQLGGLLGHGDGRRHTTRITELGDHALQSGAVLLSRDDTERGCLTAPVELEGVGKAVTGIDLHDQVGLGQGAFLFWGNEE